MNESKAPMLWWMVPLFLAFGAGGYAIASFDWCGIGSCQQNSAGEAGRDPGTSIVILVLSGLLAAVPIAAVRWTGPVWVRLLTAAAYAVILAIAATFLLTVTRG